MTHAHWDEHHAGHGHTHGHRHGHERDLPWAVAELAGFLAGCAQLPRRAIDLGCGTGADAVFLAERGIEAIGIDGSATGLDRARERAEQRGVEVEWILGDVLQLPIADASVDLALDRGCLHHIASADMGRYAAEVARVLAPGGTLLVREMNDASAHQLAVTEDALRELVADTPLHVRSIVRYESTGGERTVRTMLAVIDRA